ncbi:MAG TPA: thioredoxin domain-containing protein, partial [Pyrinomonadaceae bacterium]|nr:thioredoxin domain-containing protein [Pyrinomonadaceae bacterium]
LNLEAKALNTTPGKLIAAEKAKVANPTEDAIKAVYEANKTVIGDRTLEQVRKQIVSMLRSDPEQKLLVAYFAQLATKYKVSNGKDINSPTLAPADVVGNVNGQPITAKDFDEYAKFQLYDARVELADLILDELNDTIYDALVADEAKATQIDSGTLIANEITNKMKDYTDEERVALEGALTKKLFAKYQVKILYKEPEPIVQNVSAAAGPTQGPATAPVTIIMFSDFQCPACSATHPVLKKVMADYAGRIRFVVRDFPLESLHENAFRAALAAGAANAQGKFFEYAEILYTHQDALDVESLKKYAAQIGLNAAQFELDFNSEKTAAEVRKDMADGESYGITSTPTIFVNGVMVRSLSADGFKAAIERALKK